MNHNSRKIVELGSLTIAIVATGIMAGFFWSYTFSVNLAMQQVDGETYATIQSLFNQNVRHIMFFVFFFGGGFFTVVAVLGNLRHRKTLSFGLLLAAALVYIGGVIVFTQQVNLPLNYYTESWQPGKLPDDWAATRDAWNEANELRVVTSFLAFLLALFSLVLRAFCSENSDHRSEPGKA